MSTQGEDIQTLFQLIRELNKDVNQLNVQFAQFPGKMAEALFSCELRHRAGIESKQRWSKNSIATWTAIAIAFGSLLHSFGLF